MMKKWTPQAKVCESIYNLAYHLRENTFFKEVSSDEDYYRINVSNASKFFQDDTLLFLLRTLKVEYKKLYPNSLSNNILPKTELAYMDELYQLGIILASSIWWNRYQMIADKMGTYCTLSIATANKLFDKETNIEQVKTAIRMVCNSTKE